MQTFCLEIDYLLDDKNLVELLYQYHLQPKLCIAGLDGIDILDTETNTTIYETSKISTDGMTEMVINKIVVLCFIKDNSFRIWNPVSNEMKTFKYQRGLSNQVLHTMIDGKNILITGDFQRNVEIWDYDTTTLIETFADQPFYGNSVNSMVIINNILFTASDDCSIKFIILNILIIFSG